MPSVDLSSLVNGANILAPEIHQSAPDNSDISFDLEVLANTVVVDQPPVVVITTPANGAVLPEGPVLVQANATDVDGLIARVAFYEGPNMIGEDTTAPYGITWPSVCAGRRDFTACARNGPAKPRTSNRRGR